MDIQGNLVHLDLLVPRVIRDWAARALRVRWVLVGILVTLVNWVMTVRKESLVGVLSDWY